MPTYEYECKECGAHFEYVHSMNDPDKTTCEACGKESLQQLISITAGRLGGFNSTTGQGDLRAAEKDFTAKREARLAAKGGTSKGGGTTKPR
jgi:putative FmdB family regulatory protein